MKDQEAKEIRVKCLEFAITCSSSFKEGFHATQSEIIEYASKFYDFVCSETLTK